MACGGVPVMDMQERAGLAEKIVNACEEWGCFRVVNHGVPMTLMSDMKEVARSLLDLPLEIKQRTAHPIPGLGYTPPSPANPFLEGMGVYDMSSPGALDKFCNQLEASTHQRDTISNYYGALYDLAQDLGRKLAEGTGVKGDLFNGWQYQIRLNKYNFSRESVGLPGAITHSDPGFLTILQDDEIVGGLEVVNDITGKLVPLNPLSGSFVVNVGDIAKVWSNGKFCNVKHGVQCYEDRIRISFALFILGPKDSKLETPAELLDSEHPRLYDPLDIEEYRKLRSTTRMVTGEALELFRVTNT